MANFTYDIEDYIISIIDENLGNTSVTNDIENVLKTICDDIGSLQNKIIIYRDSEGTWDGVTVDKNNKFDKFIPLGKKHEHLALLEYGRICAKQWIK